MVTRAMLAILILGFLMLPYTFHIKPNRMHVAANGFDIKD